MFLTNTHRKQFAVFYFIIFALGFFWLFFNDTLLHQLRPVFFLNRLDVSVNFLLLTNLHKAIINSPGLQTAFDLIYILLTILLCITVYINNKWQYWLAIAVIVFNFIYAILLSILSPYSIEGFVGWLLLPLLFAFKSDKAFYYLLNLMRYFFILVFFSAALWKIRTGAIFNMEEMSGILARQHIAYITASPEDWFSKLVTYLVTNWRLSYFLYLGATLIEFIFCIGFFTKRYDNLLIIIFIVFLLFDFLLMKINYFSWVTFLGCFWYGRFAEPVYIKNKH